MNNKKVEVFRLLLDTKSAHKFVDKLVQKELEKGILYLHEVVPCDSDSSLSWVIAYD